MPCKPRLLLDYALRAGTLACGWLGLVATMKPTYYSDSQKDPVALAMICLFKFQV